MTQFDAIRGTIRSTRVARGGKARFLSYLDANRLVAVARGGKGGIEVYICGPKLAARNLKVAVNLEHREWQDQDGRRFEANQIAFPAEPHFDSIVALVCAEFLERLETSSLTRAFRDIEDLIALSFDAQPPASVRSAIGLAGELYLLGKLMTCNPQRASEFLAGWHGHTHSHRDFTLGESGVEVKTTTRPSSTHRISSIAQIEPGNSVHGVLETRLFLLSIGLVWLPPGTPGGLTIRQLVLDIEEKLPQQEKDAFIRLVSVYGDDPIHGYRHKSSNIDEVYVREFRVSFTRLYDLLDSKISLLTSDDLAEFSHVNPTSVSYEVDLPERLRGDFNPCVGISKIVTMLTEQTTTAK